MTNDEYAVVLEKIERSDLPDAFRLRARRLHARVADEPARVDDELKEMAREFASTSRYQAPESDLFKVVTLGNVHRYMVGEDWRAADFRAFLAAVLAEDEPARFVRSLIEPGRVVFPPEHSWMIAAPEVLRLSSRGLKSQLELRSDQDPPYVIFHLSLPRLLATGVMVRRPNALDAAAAAQPQWNPAGLQLGQEYLDREVPIEAVEDLIWKP